MREREEHVVVLIGPTAVGKTKTSIELAKRFNGEIISGDSMQIYRGMDIGTAKIREEEMEGVVHHLIDIRNPDEPFSVAEFQELVRCKITEIHARGKLPMIVGGTGLYIQSVIYDYQFGQVESNEKLRQELEKRAAELGPEAFHRELALVDPVSAERIHPNNVRRVIRALEVFAESGQTIDKAKEDVTPSLLYQVAVVGLAMERDQLYERINQRVDAMIEEGLIKEVKHLIDAGYQNGQAMQAIGYKEWIPYFDGTQDYDTTIQLLKQNSRRYAKRQLTWFRNKMDVEWIDMSGVKSSLDLEKKIQEISEIIEGKLQN